MYDFGITLNGFYVHDPDILEAVPLPEGLDPKVLAQLIIERSGSLYPFIQGDTYLKRQIHNWFQTNYHNFERILLAINADYSPIENYDRTEERLINRSTRDNEHSSSNHASELTGRDTTTGSTTESGSNTGSATNTASTSSTTSGENITLRAADNSETFRNVSKETSSATSSASDTATNSSSNTSSNSVTESAAIDKTQNVSDVDSMTRAGSGSEDVAETLHAHGNIGTTRNSEMVLDEIELRKYNIYEDIAARFEDKFMIAVY